jgi:hypothetical protein
MRLLVVGLMPVIAAAPVVVAVPAHASTVTQAHVASSIPCGQVDNASTGWWFFYGIPVRYHASQTPHDASCVSCPSAGAANYPDGAGGWAGPGGWGGPGGPPPGGPPPNWANQGWGSQGWQGSGWGNPAWGSAQAWWPWACT